MKDLGNYECEGQMDIFGFLDDSTKPYRITKPIRLIELFAGIGAQAKALSRLTKFENYKISEWEVHACASYHKIHMKEDKTDYSAAYTDKELIDLLDHIGVSVDGKKPLSRTKLKGRGEKWHRKVYNDFMATHNLGSITNIGGGRFRHYRYRQVYIHPNLLFSLPGFICCWKAEGNV